MDIEKSFVSIDQNFLISTLENNGAGKSRNLLVKIVLRNKESCVINGGTAAKYFYFRKDTHQGNQMSTFSLISASKILLFLVKLKSETERLTI